MLSPNAVYRRLRKWVDVTRHPQTLVDPDELFLRDRVSSIEGWLFEPARILTVHLIRSLPQTGPDAFLEIGVFEGRYISLIHYAGVQAGRRIIGIDTYQWVPEDRVQKNLLKVCGPDNRIELVRADSQNLEPKTLKDLTGDLPVRFASIDGDHNAAPVLRDLELIDATLADDGIVAVDDFMNPLAVGVTEGVGAFFTNGARRLTAFAYASNKLFLCRPDQHATYSAFTRKLVESGKHLRSLDGTRDFWRLPEPYYNQMLFGNRCLILSKGIYG